VTTLAEPEWDQATRELALAYDLVDLCPLCGGPSYLCQDPEMAEGWKAGDPVRCHATTARLQRADKVTEQTNPQHRALMFPVTLVDDGARGGSGGR
jgi:hypothetical protein